jgi:hypothetical protein
MLPNVVEGLKELSRLGAKVYTDDASVQMIDAGNSDIRDEHLKYIAPMHDLVVLLLRGTRISNDGISQLKPLSKLEHLDLSGTRIDGSCLNVISSFPALARLEVADIGSMSKYCANLYYHERLGGIDLSHTDITTEDLVRLITNSKISLFDVYGIDIDEDRLLQLNDLEAAPYRCVHVYLEGDKYVFLEIAG